MSPLNQIRFRGDQHPERIRLRGGLLGMR